MKDKNAKWNLIVNKIKQNYRQYANSKNCRIFIEIVENCVKAIFKGNEGDNKVTLEYYEDNINKIMKESKKGIMNPIIIGFLLQIHVSQNSIMDGYELLNKFCQDDMTRAFTKGESLEKYFD